jgi:hypothetical protein
MKSKMLILAGLLIVFYSSNVGAQEGINRVRITQYTQGKYQMHIELGDSFPDEILLNSKWYSLCEKKTGTEIKLPQPIPWITRPGKGVRFLGVDITYEKGYVIKFRDFEANIDTNSFVLLAGQITFKEFEKGKSKPWEKSIKPKIAQGDSTIREWGDLGLELSLSKELPKRFKFSFDASLTANKNDPNNHWKLNFYWQFDVYQYWRFGIRPFTLTLEEQATQGLTLHDLSVRAFTSLSVHPFNGIQPVYLTAGWDQSKRIRKNGRYSDDPRVHLQAQWGFVGLVGRGSSFFIDYQYWRRVEDIKNFDEIDPSQERKREYVELEFTLPITEGKNLTVRYADGKVAPTFTKDTSVHIGLEFLFGGYRVLMPK